MLKNEYVFLLVVFQLHNNISSDAPSLGHIRINGRTAQLWNNLFSSLLQTHEWRDLSKVIRYLSHSHHIAFTHDLLSITSFFLTSGLESSWRPSIYRVPSSRWSFLWTEHMSSIRVLKTVVTRHRWTPMNSSGEAVCIFVFPVCGWSSQRGDTFL